MYIYLHTYINKYLYVHTNIYVCIHISIYMHICKYIYVYIYSFMGETWQLLSFFWFVQTNRNLKQHILAAQFRSNENSARNLNILQENATLHYTATCCNTRQRTTTHRCTLQHTPSHWITATHCRCTFLKRRFILCAKNTFSCDTLQENKIFSDQSLK